MQEIEAHRNGLIKHNKCNMVKNKLLSLGVLIFMFASCNSTSGDQDGVYDSRAVESLDKMSEVIGELNSCSYTLNTYVSEKDATGKVDVFSNENDVYMRGPNKMHVRRKGTKGEYGYWYNGSDLSFYSYNKSTYDTVDAPDRIVEAIDFLHDKYGIDFPASDLFYPTLTDDILEHFNTVLYFDNITIDEINCVLVEATNEMNVLQMWIEKNTNLPYKILLGGRSDDGNYYEGVFTHWKTDPKLPDILFEFEPPPNSTRVNIKERSKK